MRPVRSQVAALVLFGALLPAIVLGLAGCTPNRATTSFSTAPAPAPSTTASAPSTSLSTVPGDQEAAKAIYGWEAVFKARIEAKARAVSVDGGKAVWADQTESGGGTIEMFDVATGATQTLVTVEGLVGPPRISGDDVVFDSEAKNSAAVYLHRISSGETTQISFDGWGSYPEVTGSNVVWMQGALTTPTIYKYVFYDLATGRSTVIAQVEQDEGTLGPALLVGRKWVVWFAQTRAGGAGFWSYSVATGQTRHMSVGAGARPDALDGDTFYYVPDAGSDVVIIGQPQELRAYNLATGEDKLVSAEDRGIQWTSAEGGRVAWASWDAAGRYIKILDGATSDTTRLPLPGYQVGVLQLKGDLLLWRAQRASPASTLGGGYVFAYDMERRVATRLSDTLTEASRVGSDGATVSFAQTRVRAGKTTEEVVAFTLTRPEPALLFPDVPGLHPYRTAVAGLVSTGVFGGRSSAEGPGLGPLFTLFKPDDPVTYEDFATMLVAALGIPDSGDPMATLVGLGFLGSPTGEVMTRKALIAAVVGAAAKLRPGLVTAFTGSPGTREDFHKTGDPEAAKAEWSGLVDGLVDYFSRTWDPSRPASRGEAAQVIWNLAASGEESP